MSLPIPRLVADLSNVRGNGLLASFGSQGTGQAPVVFSDATATFDIHTAKKSTSGVRPFDNADISTIVSGDGVQVSVGKRGQDPWFYANELTPVSITPVAITTSIAGSGTTNEVQIITLGEGVFGGTFSYTLTLKNWTTGDGASNVSTPFVISGLATAEQILAILRTHAEAVFSGAVGLRVTGNSGGPFTIEFINKQGLQNIPEGTVTDIDLLVPERYTVTLEAQPQLATDIAAGVSLAGYFEIKIQESGGEPETRLFVPAAVTDDIITDDISGNAVAGAFKFAQLIVGLTGGGSTKLDGIVTVGKTFDVVSFVLSGNIASYQLVSGTDAEASPLTIRPDDYDGSTNARVWKRLTTPPKTINTQTGTTYTLVLADLDKVVVCTNAAGCTVTLLDAAGVPFPLACELELVATGGTLTINSDATTITMDPEYGATAQAALGSTMNLRKVGTELWSVKGKLVVP